MEYFIRHSTIILYYEFLIFDCTIQLNIKQIYFFLILSMQFFLDMYFFDSIHFSFINVGIVPLNFH